MNYPRPTVLNTIPWDKHAIIEASAGTGKTFTLEHMVVEFIIVKKIPLENLALLTFSEKAADELRLRIRTLIVKVLQADGCVEELDNSWLIGDVERDLLRQSLKKFEKASISTLHAFFMKILLENAFEGGRLLEQSSASDVEVFDKAFLMVMRQDTSSHHRRQQAMISWLANHKTIDDLKNLIYKSHKSKGELHPVIDIAACEKLVMQLTQCYDSKVFAEYYQRSNINKKSLGSILNELPLLEELCAEYKVTQNIFNFCHGMTEISCKRLVAPTLNKKIKDLTFYDDFPNELIRCIDCLKEWLKFSLSVELLMVKLFREPLRKRLKEIKESQGLFEFDDMISVVKEALMSSQGRGLAKDIRSRFPIAMIDEFQDTDETQWEVFKKIYIESEETQLYLVGDPKQAIYSFRGADLQAYYKAREEICAAGGKQVNLDTNYRSSSLMVQFFNQLFSNTTDQSFFMDDMIDYQQVNCGCKELVAADKEGKTVAPVVLLRAEDEAALTTDDFLDRQDCYIVREILELVKHKKIQYGSPTLRTLRWKDIFILTRKNSEADRVQKVLTEAGIPCCFFKKNALLRSKEARELLDVLNAIVRPGSVPHRLKAWVTSYFDISYSQIPYFKQLPDTHPLIRVFYEWKELADKSLLTDLFNHLTEDSGKTRRSLMSSQDDQTIENTQQLIEMLLQQVNEGVEDLNTLIYFLEDKIRHVDLSGDTVQRVPADTDRVQLLSSHKSKGLEAPVVFVYGGFNKSNATNKLHKFHINEQVVTFVGKATDEVKERVASEELQDDQRLMYVALTRAQVRLYLPWVPKDKGNKLKVNGCYSLVNSRLTDFFETGELDNNLFEINDLITSPPEIQEKKSISVLLKPNNSRSQLPFDILKQRYNVGGTTSYSAKKRHEHYDQKELIEISSEEGRRDLHLPAGSRFGVLLHELLEMVPKQYFHGNDLDSWLSHNTIKTFVSEKIRQYGFDLSTYEYVCQLIHNAYTKPINLGEGGVVESLHRLDKVSYETEFLYPDLSNREYVIGYVDMIFEFNDKVYMVDWKTDVLDNYSPKNVSEHVANNYRIQIDLYSTALKRYLKKIPNLQYGGMLYVYLRGLDDNIEGSSGICFL